MKKNIIIILALLCSISVCGQSKDAKKAIEKVVEANEVIINDLNDTIKSLNSQLAKLDSTIQKISKRKFPVGISEDELRAELKKVTIKELIDNKNNTRDKLKRAQDTETGKTYCAIIDIYHSLTLIYNEESNNKYIELLDSIKPLDCHKEEFEKLSFYVSDYRFVMNEVVRVFSIIDKLNISSVEGIKDKLNETNELEFITKDFPFAYYDCVEKYIEYNANNGIDNNSAKKAKEALLNELKEACPFAFPSNENKQQ